MPAPARARIYPGVASVESAGSANFQVGKRARPQRCHDTPQAYYGPKLRPAHQVGRVRRANLRFAMLYASGYVDVSADNLGRACELSSSPQSICDHTTALMFVMDGLLSQTIPAVSWGSRTQGAKWARCRGAEIVKTQGGLFWIVVRLPDGTESLSSKKTSVRGRFG